MGRHPRCSHRRDPYRIPLTSSAAICARHAKPPGARSGPITEEGCERTWLFHQSTPADVGPHQKGAAPPGRSPGAAGLGWVGHQAEGEGDGLLLGTTESWSGSGGAWSGPTRDTGALTDRRRPPRRRVQQTRRQRPHRATGRPGRPHPSSPQPPPKQSAFSHLRRGRRTKSQGAHQGVRPSAKTDTTHRS